MPEGGTELMFGDKLKSNGWVEITALWEYSKGEGHIPDDNSTELLAEAHHLFLIGNCIWSWLIGYVCALCCGFAYSRRQKLLSK